MLKRRREVTFLPKRGACNPTRAAATYTTYGPPRGTAPCFDGDALTASSGTTAKPGGGSAGARLPNTKAATNPAKTKRCTMQLVKRNAYVQGDRGTTEADGAGSGSSTRKREGGAGRVVDKGKGYWKGGKELKTYFGVFL